MLLSHVVGHPRFLSLLLVGLAAPSARAHELRRTPATPTPMPPDCTRGQWVEGCCRDPSGEGAGLAGGSLFAAGSAKIGTCATEENPLVSTDPRVFGPTLWRAFHMIAANFPSPPTEAAHRACVGFVMALPYLVPCRHCGYDLGEFIKRNVENDGRVVPGCFGFSDETQDFTEPCASPESACLSTYGLTSFFARAHNNVNSHTNPCRKPYTTKDALDEYLAAPDGTCFHNTVWGNNQLCTGPYCSTDLPPFGKRYGTSCYEAGSDSTSGTGCDPILGCPEHPEADPGALYFGTNSTCDRATADACGSVKCE